MLHAMFIPGWLPCSLNKLLGSHWAKAGRMKAADREQIAAAVKVYGIPVAQCKRRIDVTYILPPGKRASDPDSQYKSLLDALVHAGALRNDSHVWAEPRTPRVARGPAEAAGTLVLLEDLQ